MGGGGEAQEGGNDAGEMQPSGGVCWGPEARALLSPALGCTQDTQKRGYLVLCQQLPDPESYGCWGAQMGAGSSEACSGIWRSLALP